MSWMEALNAMAEHARRTSNTFFVFVNKTYSGAVSQTHSSVEAYHTTSFPTTAW